MKWTITWKVVYVVGEYEMIFIKNDLVPPTTILLPASFANVLKEPGLRIVPRAICRMRQYGCLHSQYSLDWRCKTEGRHEEVCKSRIEAQGNAWFSYEGLSAVCLELSNARQTTSTFDIHFQDPNVTVEQVRDAVSKELDGPGKLLGHRSMQKKVRQQYGLNVPRDLVHDVMFDLDPEGLADRFPIRKKGRAKGHFTTRGIDWVHSLDGHDKLMGYQNSTFLLAVYGCIDTASHKLLWLRVWTSNTDPDLIGRWYLEYLYEPRRLPSIIRVDKGTATSVMATMQAYLRQHHNDMDPTDTVIFGPSTSNQVPIIYLEGCDLLASPFLYSRLVSSCQKCIPEYVIKSWLFNP